MTRVGADDPLAGDARSVAARRDERAAGDRVRRGDRRDRLAADRHPRVRRGRRRLAAVRAQSRWRRGGGAGPASSDHRQRAVLTLTVGPVITIDAPLPFWM